MREILRLLAQIVERMRRRHPRVRIVLPGDSGFRRDELMSWCEVNGLKYRLDERVDAREQNDQHHPAIPNTCRST